MNRNIHITERKDFISVLKVQHNAFYKQMEPRLKELFDDSYPVHKAGTSSLIAQIDLLRCILDVEEARKAYKRYKGLFGKALRSLTTSGAPLEQIKLTQERIEDMQRFESAADFVLSRLRSIGDGIAWRFLDYNRRALRLLADHNPVSIPQKDIGLVTEVSELLRLAIAEKRPVVLNVINNFLRVGDLTTYNPGTDDVSIIEVKSGRKKTARTRRQAKYMTLIQEGLTTGVHSIGDVKLHGVSANKPLRTHIQSVERAMEEAEERYVSSRLFGDYLSVVVFSPGRIVENLAEDKWEDIWKEGFDRLFSVGRRKSDVLLPIMHNTLAVSHFSPILAPYVVFPINPARRFDLLTGKLVVFSILNVSGLARWLGKRGWTAHAVRPPSTEPDVGEFPLVPALYVGRKNRGFQMGIDTLLVAAMEFWMPESVESSAEVILGVRTTAYYQVNFPNVGKYALD